MYRPPSFPPVPQNKDGSAIGTPEGESDNRQGNVQAPGFTSPPQHGMRPAHAPGPFPPQVSRYPGMSASPAPPNSQPMPFTQNRGGPPAFSNGNAQASRPSAAPRALQNPTMQPPPPPRPSPPFQRAAAPPPFQPPVPGPHMNQPNPSAPPVANAFPPPPGAGAFPPPPGAGAFPPPPGAGTFPPPPGAGTFPPPPGAGTFLSPPLGSSDYPPVAPGLSAHGASNFAPPPLGGQFAQQNVHPGHSMQRPMSRTGQPSSPRIDPTQIPRPTEKDSDPVIHFETRLNGQHQIPPLACSRHLSRDVGDCDPKFMRLTLNYIPMNSELCSNAALPLAAFIQPLALRKTGEEDVKVVDMGAGGPIRCGRCRAYMNPFMTFQDGGRSFICPFCNVKNETPTNYFCYLGPDGQRRDTYDRPELHKGTVEFEAPSAFMVRPPMPPVHFFLIDATFASVTSGVLQTVCSSIKLILNSIQGQDRALVGIATFDSAIQFYHVKNNEGGPQVLIVSDTSEVFAPLPSLLLPLKEQKESIIEILDLIPKLYSEQKNGESCGGAAIEAAVEALKPTGGKLHAMLCTRPSQGSRALKPREPQISGSAEKIDKEKQMILLPQDNSYRSLAMTASEFFICLDLFFFAHAYIDISTLSVLSTMTGGSLYRYENFTVQISAQQFLNDLRWNVSRPQGLEAVLRVRCSSGLEIENYLGAMSVRNQHEIDLPGIDCDKSIMVKFLHDDKLEEGSQAYLQCALLYTTTTGHRRIRVSTLAVPVTSDVTSVFRGADLESTLNYLARKTAAMLPGNTFQAGKDLWTVASTNVLVAYRKFVSSTSSSGQLILPDSLKLLPMYALSFMKSAALAYDRKPDERAAFLSLLMSLPCSKIMRLLYGHFFELDAALAEEKAQVPDSLWLTSEKIETGKLYLFENGQEIIIKVEAQVPPETLKALFGIEQINVKAPEPTVIYSDHPLNAKLQQLLNEIRMKEGCYMSLRVALKSTPQDSRILNFLIEDKNQHGASYIQFLCAIHRMIQQKLM